MTGGVRRKRQETEAASQVQQLFVRGEQVGARIRTMLSIDLPCDNPNLTRQRSVRVAKTKMKGSFARRGDRYERQHIGDKVISFHSCWTVE